MFDCCRLFYAYWDCLWRLKCTFKEGYDLRVGSRDLSLEGFRFRFRETSVIFLEIDKYIWFDEATEQPFSVNIGSFRMSYSK